MSKKNLAVKSRLLLSFFRKLLTKRPFSFIGGIIVILITLFGLYFDTYGSSLVTEGDNLPKYSQHEEDIGSDRQKDVESKSETQIKGVADTDEYAVSISMDGGENGDSESDHKDLFEVIRVVDGDTIKVDYNGSILSVRLIGIDAPETSKSPSGEDCYGDEARNYLKKLIPKGSKVQLLADPLQGDVDKYNRLLRYIETENGEDINLLMISQGFAWEYTYKNSVYQRQKEYLDAEKNAMTLERGLWASDTCGGKKKSK